MAAQLPGLGADLRGQGGAVKRKHATCLLCRCRKAAPGSNVCTACYWQQYPPIKARVCGKDKREPVTRAELHRLKERHRVLLTRLRRRGLTPRDAASLLRLRDRIADERRARDARAT